ncbi:hypothetical protein D3C76_618250 [compost metagenome]
MEVAEIEEVHVRRRVEATQRPVQIDGCCLEVDRHALRRYDLHAIARQDVFLDGIDCALVIVLGKTGTEYRLGGLLAGEIQATARCDRLAQLFQQLFELGQAIFVGVFLGRVSQYDGVHLARQVVEHHHGIGNHQQDIRHAQRVRIRALAQAFFHIADAVIAEVTDQAAIETWQAGNGRHLVTILEGLDECQWVFHLVPFDFLAVMGNHDLVTMHAHNRAAWQADDGVAPPLLAALHRLQQIGVGLVGQLQVDRQRRVEVGQGFAGKRDTVIAGSGQTQEFFAGHDQPRGLRV